MHEILNRSGILAGLVLFLFAGFWAVKQWSRATGSAAAPAAAPAAAGAGAPSPAKKSWWNRLNPLPWLGAVPWKRIMAVVVLLIVAWEGIFGFYSMTNAPRLPGLGRIPHWETPSLATAGSWMWAHWLPVLVLYGSLMALLALSSKGTSWAKEAENFRGVLTVAVAAAFVLLPPLGWVMNYDAGSETAMSSSQETGPRAYNPQSTWTQVEIPPNGSTPFIELPAGQTLHIGGQNHMLITYSLADGSTVSYHKDEPVPTQSYRQVVAFRFSNLPFRFNGKVVSYTWTISAQYAFCPNKDEVGQRCVR